MITQVRIYPEPSSSQKVKGDFFEDLLRAIMEFQRFRVTERINFTGTEIDLLCEHMDRRGETALVECKARETIVAADVKNFAYDVLVARRSQLGFFVHTSELQHQVAGMVSELHAQRELMFWGPEKIIELLQHGRLVAPPLEANLSPTFTPAKRILLYTYRGRFWLTLYSGTLLPTHYVVTDAAEPGAAISSETAKWVAELDDVKGLIRYEPSTQTAVTRPTVNLEAVADVQQADTWEDYYRPVGAKYFVGRNDSRHKLYQFVQAPITGSSARRVFFVEGRSGWGKSSLVAELRSRSRNRRNKNVFYVLAVDSRSANSGEFVSLAVAKLVMAAAKRGFIPQQFTRVNIPSYFDILASSTMDALLTWLQENRRVLVVVFDQFEDVFRKLDLFRAFHKLMVDVNETRSNLIVGFSWKSEINIPIDNPAYGLWQQARDIAEPFRVEEFLGYEVDRVLRQLEVFSERQLPGDLKRRLKDSSQGYPWLIKRLAIHCYEQMKRGITPEDLVDQNLNVEELLNEDMDRLSGDEARALKLVAKRAYDGDPFDVAEVDEKVREEEIHSLLNKRLIVRSGGKYNVYWDIFRDFLVEKRVPILGESFLLRQFPQPCISTLSELIGKPPGSIAAILSVAGRITEGTALNRLRELRYLGVVTKVSDLYHVRPSIHSVQDFKTHMQARLKSHVVSRLLSKLTTDSIGHEEVLTALKESFKGYGFSDHTWSLYASYFIAWLRYAGVDFGRRLSDIAGRSVGLGGFIPNWRPEKDLDVFFKLPLTTNDIPRPKGVDKALYDLKSLGLVVYNGPTVLLTKRGLTVKKLDQDATRMEIALLALAAPKIAAAVEAVRLGSSSGGVRFEAALAPILSSIRSDSYREVAGNLLKAWAKFVVAHLPTMPGDANNATSSKPSASTWSNADVEPGPNLGLPFSSPTGDAGADR